MTILDEFHRDDRRVLDRLVDGELGVDERRELLAVFDNEPGAGAVVRWPFWNRKPGGGNSRDWPANRSWPK